MLGFSRKLSKFKPFIDSLQFDHFLALTDDTGMLQHSKFSIPDRRMGYTVDDNARALILSTGQYDLRLSEEWSRLTSRFLAFLMAVQGPDGRFHNFTNYRHDVEDDLGSGDHLGRTLWATGIVVDSPLAAGVRTSAKEVFDKALPWALESTSPRVKAHAIKGLSRYINHFDDDLNASRNLSYLVNQLCATYEANRSADWRWFEDVLSYENWRLPECLFEAYLVGQDCLKIAEQSLKFLTSVEFIDDVFAPVGSEGWYRRNHVKAQFDQLPVEAGSAVEALAIAGVTTGSSQYWDLALQALSWYHGMNQKGVTLYDTRSGECCDGISPFGLNLNKGAESALSYLLAVTRLEMIGRQEGGL
jgi:hypothetical protein